MSNWHELDAFPGVTEAWRTLGDLYGLEVQVQDDGTVVGTAWKRVPPTFWEPEDVVCVHEETYGSVLEAKSALETLQSEDIRAEQEADEHLAAELRELSVNEN